MDNAIHWINVNSADNAIGFLNYYSLDGDLSGGQRYRKKKNRNRSVTASDDVPSLLLSCYLDLVHYLLCIYIGLTASVRLLEYECKMKPSPTEKWRRSCSSLRSWRYSVIKGLAAEPRSKKKGVGTRRLKYRLPENLGILNSPHTSVGGN